MSESSWSGRVGSNEFAEIFQSAANGAKRAAHARALVSRARQLGMFEPSELAEKARQLWGSGGEKKLDASARQAAFQLSTGGIRALQQALESKDPLERLLILSKVSEYLGPDDSSASDDLQNAVLLLRQRHGDEILALSNSASSFAKVRETDNPAEQTADAASGLRSVYLDAGRMPGDAVISPQKLAQNLIDQCGESNFSSALEQLSAGVLADLRSSQPSRHALRVGVALTNAGAFTAVRIALGLAKELRGRLAGAGITLDKADPNVACKLLQESAGGCSGSRALCNAIFGEAIVAKATKSPVAMSIVRQVVQSTPDSWWPADKNGAKLKLLNDIDSLLSVLGDAGSSPQAEAASKLRAMLPTKPA